MQQPHGQLRDPVGWTWIIAGAFLTLVLMRLNVPGHAFFDEVHYVPAARAWLNGQLLNLEHPPLGKLILAGSMRILGDNVWGWRQFAGRGGGLIDYCCAVPDMDRAVAELRRRLRC